ncbi:MAG TPA: DNA gyrase C-terminal beta-propeller domain-containing protein, partial [Bacteroidia bacterium]|nr:DNA gyrase C-terminal beta-propeller domain-containing protein [Bacteroidia bacterium]
FIIMCTKKGTIKKTSLKAYSRPRQNGINAINVKDGDTLLEAKLTNGSNEIMLASKSGKLVRFPEEKARAIGRNATGVRGIRLSSDSDEVIGMICISDPKSNVLVVSETGYGKRSELEEYRVTNRGGKGVKTINITEKTGNLIALKDVTDDNDIMIINKSGITIRLAVADLRVIGRATQGVKFIDLGKNDEIAAVAKVDAEPEMPEELDENGNLIVRDEAPSNENESTSSSEEGDKTE